MSRAAEWLFGKVETYGMWRDAHSRARIFKGVLRCSSMGLSVRCSFMVCRSVGLDRGQDNWTACGGQLAGNG
jgi:hypothetical protein